ncbi:DUF7601 domain-containing protein [Enterococcus faecium]|uniref:Thioester-forming surface-anchored protein n=1 Tax=Enterococcus faecium TaxID=1352 RepID=A0A242B1D8_ENTFC|nr:thioester-forming surface-anchored protein [Enterococcus faecium]OTN86678.1 hypothetical protein A5810_002967 [Enterococcus faecium]
MVGNKKRLLLLSWLSLLLILGALTVQINVNAETTSYYGYVDLNRYDGFSNLTYYVEPTDKSSPPEMVFCLNRGFQPPGYLLPKGDKSNTTYSKIPITKATRFADNLQNPLKDIGTNDDITRHEWAAARIMNVIYQAYYNYSNNVLTSTGLNELQSRIIVQFAIWHFSDDYYPSVADFDKHNLPTSARNAYNQLVRTDNRDSENIEQKLKDKGVVLSLYLPNNYAPSDSAKEDKPPQALIGSNRTDSIPPFRFEKRAADDHSDLLDGAKFKIVAGGGYVGSEGYPEFEYTSSKDNPYIQLSPGKYRIIEEQAPDGYELPEDSLDAGSKVIKVTTDGQLTYLDSIDNNGVEHFIKLPNDTLTWDNKKKDGNLSLSKKVEGSAGDRNADFIFKISLTNTQNQPFSGEVSLSGNNRLGEKITFIDGQATVTLRANEDVSLNHIEGGSHYTVEEINDDNYTTTISVGNQEGQISKTSTGTIIGNVSLSITNTKDVIPPTGLSDARECYIALLCLALFSLIVLRVSNSGKV